jgi:ATP-dependent exoDNAse (exonuclease V) beta subunit
MRLTPPLAASLLAAEAPLAAASAAGAMGPEDRRVLDHLRLAIPAWLARVDRVQPSELLAGILEETGYSDEIAGARHRQARENLKKLAGMIRRFQNRGYATLARVADHLEQLAVGDESNAALDAHDAVSLMTVHAAKGLEFPIVFLVNLGRGTGNTRAPIRVASDAAGDASVAVADYQSEADEDAVAREREETKRLLYVALTRARDRLYLSGVVANGTFRATRGSLGEVLPASLKVVLTQAAGMSDRTVTWAGPQALGAENTRPHELLVVSDP